ncbi:E3 ubiquitin-protein ligase DMA2 [Zancudomyces culisetae]|uniref:E3 ubiquitin-protein ligase DMA2 n=1 Tax=Zancudomyces culisetae TaxID=1213189 RepID=A0A1R1PTF3_ZANCU|nr:E3 ubiquitin-protein ligase DMA2 [Zancudomyces culisetae]|eukprot:OMH84183.1 E3 ubiquitin-protein ligase DMA2 [Zancudomyces culisetae]
MEVLETVEANNIENSTDTIDTPKPTTAHNKHSQHPHIRIVPNIIDVRHSLYFEVIDRDAPEGLVLKVGRFTDKVSTHKNKIAFKSKVVSRSHAEIWTEGGVFYIKDTKSSSGTFLNNMRLCPPGVESRPFQLKDGDTLQLGVDYQGGSIDIYKCVRIRLEINRNWQRNKDGAFRSMNSMSLHLKITQVLKSIQKAYYSLEHDKDTDKNECCICLCTMQAFQALFVAPCSHCYHYKCVKQMLFTSTGFSCPICRTYADLEADINSEEYGGHVSDEEMDHVDNILPAMHEIRQPAAHAASVATNPIQQSPTPNLPSSNTSVQQQQLCSPTPSSITQQSNMADLPARTNSSASGAEGRNLPIALPQIQTLGPISMDIDMESNVSPNNPHWPAGTTGLGVDNCLESNILTTAAPVPIVLDSSLNTAETQLAAPVSTSNADVNSNMIN